MGSLGDMKARIALELVRGDLATQIANAINDAIGIYQSDHFYFNEPALNNQPLFNTVAGQATYTTADCPEIAQSAQIAYLTYVQGNATFKIVRRSPLDIQLANQNGQIVGPPDEWCYAGEALTIYPWPDTAYPISIMGQLFAAAPANDEDASTPWTNDAERLIRCRAKYELAVHVTRNASMAQAMSPDVNGGPGGGPGATYREWQNLKGTTALKVSKGRISPMPF